jgi:hypothetical protein
MEFKPWPKTPRFSRDIIVTEKIDGTNACIHIEVPPPGYDIDDPANVGVWLRNGLLIRAGSRTRWIHPGKSSDNYSFAAWVLSHADELTQLGVGTHFGEWWGAGIQRRYGIDEKRFSLFNTNRWHADFLHCGIFELITDPVTRAVSHRAGPKCCYVVPTLYRGLLDTEKVDDCLRHLTNNGSVAAPGFADPEGVCIYHTASGQVFKKTCKDDDKAKGQQ